MCSPLALGVMSAVGSGMAAYGQYQAGQTEKAIGDYNANVRQVQAQEVTQQGMVAVDQQRARVRQIEGQQITQAAAGGAVAGSGTFADLGAETAQYGEMDAQNIRLNALKQAWGLNAEAGIQRMEGNLGAQSGTWNAMGGLLTGGVRAYSTYKTAAAAGW